jgi:hypothetical protein
LANPTTNYGFVLPTSSDLVTDLPADFDVALQGVDTRLKALQPGTTLGDLAYSSATANTNTRLGIGTTGQVLTVAAGAPSWATLSSGAVVQVKSATYATQTSTTSTSYVASGLSLSITPTSASNKILCFVNVSGHTIRGGNDTGFFMRLRRGSTAILDDGAYVTYVEANNATRTQLGMPVTRVFLDSPATTSATTYDIQIKSDGGGAATIAAQWNNNTSIITLMEVTP